METRSPSPIRREQAKQRLVSTEGLTYALAEMAKKPLPIYSRILGGGICLIFFGSLTWAAISKVDEVASAPAELIPFTRVQPIRPLAGGLLREIKVKEGDRVAIGDALVQLDPTISEAEFQRLSHLAALARENLTRLEAERDGKSQAGSALQNQILASRSRQSKAELNRQLGVIRAVQAELDRLRTSLSYARIKENSYSMLSQAGAIPRLDHLDTQNQVASLQGEIAAKEQELYQAQQEAERLSAEHQSGILTEMKQQKQELADLEGKLAQAKEQRSRETIAASVNGTVYNVKIAQAGATVQPGEELLSIVPEGEELILEAKTLNRDRGFIQSKMRVKIKLATFPYQEFGMIEGTVWEVSPNAVTDPQLGLVFPTRIKLQQQTIRVRGQEILLTPGMEATAEIVTRQRTILSFLLEPIVGSWNEAFSIR